MTAAPLPDVPLRSARLLLRTWVPGDADALFAAFHDPEVLRFSWSSQADHRLADAVAFLQEREPARLRGEEVQWAITCAEGGRLLGGASLYQVDADAGIARVGYWLGADARGHGIATEAVGAVVAYAFEHVRLQRLELTCGPDNVASQRVAQRAGFVAEGRLRSHTPFKGGRRDSLLFSLLPGDR